MARERKPAQEYTLLRESASGLQFVKVSSGSSFLAIPERGWRPFKPPAAGDAETEAPDKGAATAEE